MRNIENKDAQDRLLGVLIALANAAQDNENWMTEETDRVLQEGVRLALTPESVPESQLLEWTQAAVEEKWKLIPTCRDCASPCGRFEPVSIAERRQQEGEEIFASKCQILTDLYELVCRRDADDWREALCEGLRAVGLWNPTPDMIVPVGAQLREILRK